MHYFLLIYFNSKPLHVSSRLAAHHQEHQLSINSNCYSQHTEFQRTVLYVFFSHFIYVRKHVTEHKGILRFGTEIDVGVEYWKQQFTAKCEKSAWSNSNFI
jgi:hypothetical protein